MIRFFAAFCALLAAPAAADFDAASYPAYETCALCHGLFGQSRTAKFPHLAGQKPGYLEAQIRAFLVGERSNDGGQMVSIMTELQPEDIPLVVEWFSTQDPPDPSARPATDIGERLFVNSGCTVCHASADNAPHLTSQHVGYLEKQMNDFADGLRTHSDVAAMHQELLQEIGAGIIDIASYLASVERPK